MYKDDNETIASILALALIFFFVSFLIATSDQQKKSKGSQHKRSEQIRIGSKTRI